MAEITFNDKLLALQYLYFFLEVSHPETGETVIGGNYYKYTLSNPICLSVKESRNSDGETLTEMLERFSQEHPLAKKFHSDDQIGLEVVTSVLTYSQQDRLVDQLITELWHFNFRPTRGPAVRFAYNDED